MKSFHVRWTGYLYTNQKNGIQVAVLSRSRLPILRKRIADLGINLFFLGKLEKRVLVLN